MYEQITHDIKVSVKPVYLDDQSSPEDGHFVWAYSVKIENSSQQQVQLINRHWKITDAQGRSQEVRGPGVVGEQPILKPGDSFEYTSGTPLPTASGFMHGAYEMETTNGEHFEIQIPAFSLDSPHEARRVH